jgi:hypothetical protein
MFRAISCLSSGHIVSIQHMVSSLSVSDRPVYRLRENCRSVLSQPVHRFWFCQFALVDSTVWLPYLLGLFLLILVDVQSSVFWPIVPQFPCICWSVVVHSLYHDFMYNYYNYDYYYYYPRYLLYARYLHLYSRDKPCPYGTPCCNFVM